jgi:hypothetical protein
MGSALLYRYIVKTELSYCNFYTSEYRDLDNTSTQDMLVFCVSLLCVAIGVALVAKRDGAPGDGSAENDLDRDQFDNVGVGFGIILYLVFFVAYEAHVACPQP